jgi:hypothetical protein
MVLNVASTHKGNFATTGIPELPLRRCIGKRGHAWEFSNVMSDLPNRDISQKP